MTNISTIRDQIHFKGKLRASKPKDGVAAYVWRMVGFYTSTQGNMQCMPVTADWDIREENIPADWPREAPADWLNEQVDKNVTNSNHREQNLAFFAREGFPSAEAYYRNNWTKRARRQAWIKTVLDPIVDQLVDEVPARQRHGVIRWGRALGVL